MRISIFVVVMFVSITKGLAQEVVTISDTNFLSYTHELKDRGNFCYEVSGNQYELLRIIEEYQRAIDARWSTGKLSVERKDSLMQEVNKLWGDYYYLHADEDKLSYDKAEKYFRSCLAFTTDPVHRQYNEIHHDEFILHRELAQLFYKQARYEEACEEMAAAVRMASLYLSPDDDETLDILSQYAICKARIAQYDEALETINFVITQYHDIDTERYSEALRKKAKILMLRKEAVTASSVTLQGNVPQEPDIAAEALTCYRSFFNLKRDDALQHFLGMSSEEREQYWMRIRPFVTDCYRLEDVDTEGFLFDVTLFAKGLLLQLDSAGAGHQNILATWQMIQQRLKPNACAIEFVQYEKYGRQQMGALVLKKTGNPCFVKMADPDSVMNFEIGSFKVRERLADFRNNDRINGLYNDSLGLNVYIWNQQLREAMGPVKDVWFAPDGYTHQLAIEYLLPQQMEGMVCHRLSSTRRLLEDSRALSRPTALIVGGVSYMADVPDQAADNDSLAYCYIQRQHVTFKYLENSKTETEAIHRQRNNPNDTLLLDTHASEGVFRQICSRYPIIHISTHGCFGAATIPQGTDLMPCAQDNSLSESLLAFAGLQHSLSDDSFDNQRFDGILSAKEIASLDLSQAELVILCCCETGLGYVTADGVYGIQRGLKNAGAKAVICTLWDINDKSSAFFMINFHRFLSEGESIHHAFYKARSAMQDYSDMSTSASVSNPLTMSQGQLAVGMNFNRPCYRDAFILIDALE